MNPNIDEFFYMLKDLGTSKEVHAHFVERDKKDLRIKSVSIAFTPVGSRVEGRMQMDYDDPNKKLVNEDLIITMELRSDSWKIIEVNATKF